ncbi:MAG: hypothetical protein HOA05_05025 [Candidatus Marinimicrobia bacterium]|nr:hypothetical protein [Candidatus Neomarinimicrobiota bacterium]
MSNKVKFFACLSICFYCSTSAQVSSKVDTIYNISDENSIQLTHPFILESSVLVLQGGAPILVKKIQAIEGILILPNTDPNFPIVISYDYLTNGLPLSVGPRWRSLPKLNLENIEILSKKEQLYSGNSDSESNIYSSGSIFRQLSVSPLGGSDFTGGLQMQLNGKLTKNMMVSGILTDQDLPIQPEGTTRELEELDQVYLMVTHPNYSVDAGDIIYEKKISNSNNINRKLVGLKNHYKKGQWSGSGVYAGSKGNYTTLEIKGRDGKQGPYQLIGSNGNRDIIVLSGTEKVWVDGIKLIRGQNHDYTIDYSLGEIHFTPKVLIHADSDLFIEYQYSDFEYQKGFSGGSLKRNFGKSSFLTFGFFKESDQFKKNDWSQDIQDSLSATESGNIQISTEIPDDDGDYIFTGQRYEYSPDEENQPRYAITFQFDPDGEYIRKISGTGRIFYEFNKPETDFNNNTDRYSPFRTIHGPKLHQFGFVGGDISIGNYMNISSQLMGSGLNQNTMAIQQEKKEGFSRKIDISIDTLVFGPAIWTAAISNWYRSNDYFALGQENDVMQQRLWNLDSAQSNGVEESKITSEMIFQNFGSTNIELAELKVDSNNNRSRLNIVQQIFHPRFNNSFFNYVSIKKRIGAYTRSQGRMQIHFSKINLFITQLREEETKLKRFQNMGAGLQIKNKMTAIETGIDLRKDESFQDSLLWETDSDDFIGFMNYRSESRSGWKQDIIFKKRVKSFEDNSTTTDYSLAKVLLGFKQDHKPIQWELQAKTEESFLEKRAIVYDSVGVGLGQYRYDPIFNTYISDPNGAFISYTIPTGKRDPNTVIEGSQKFTIDLGKISGFPNITIRGNNRLDYRGSGIEIKKLMQPNITDSLATLSRLNSRLEMIYYGKNRFRSWIDNQQALNGLDPRGNDVDQSNEFGLEINQTLSPLITIKNSGQFRKKYVESTVSNLRNRDVKGWWNEIQLQVKLSESLDFDLGLMGGFDSGNQQGKPFSSQAYGLLLNGRFFFKKTGRFQSQISWVNAAEKNKLPYLPPEALNGFPVGTSFRSNTRLQYFLNRSVSMIFTLNTIDDSRYDNFITFRGEIRAHI